MNWKDWPYWSKGMIYSVIVWVFILFLWGLSIAVSEKGKCSLISFLGSGTLLGCFLAPIIIGLIGVIPITLIGALIGWIVGKKKNTQ